MTCHRDIARAAGKAYTFRVEENVYVRDWQDEKSWPQRIEAAIDSGEKLTTQTLVPWQIVAYRWAEENADRQLILTGPRWHWTIRKCDQHVEFISYDLTRLEERIWITRWGTSKTLIGQSEERKAA